MNGRIFALLLITAAIIGVAAAVGVIAYMERDDDEPLTELAELPAAPDAAPAGAASASAAPQASVSQPSAGQMETLAGTVESVEGRSLTIAAEQGSETATVEEGASVTLFIERSLDDLEEGMTVNLAGERGEDGVTRAELITLGYVFEMGALGVGAQFADGSRSGPLGARIMRTGEPPSAEDIAELKRQLGTEIPPEAIQRIQALAEQGGGQLRGRGGAGGAFGQRGVSGEITQIGDGRITLETARGTVEATYDDDTQIREIVIEGELADLPIGAQVRLLGQRDEEDVFRAVAVIMNPDLGEALGGLFVPGDPSQGGSSGP